MRTEIEENPVREYQTMDRDLGSKALNSNSIVTARFGYS
jgi:hypothetical protein